MSETKHMQEIFVARYALTQGIYTTMAEIEGEFAAMFVASVVCITHERHRRP